MDATTAEQLGQSTFEQELFSNGTFEYHEQPEIDAARSNVSDSIAFFGDDAPQDFLTHVATSSEQHEEKDLVWKAWFSGKIPLDWGDNPTKVAGDFEEAKKQAVRLSRDLINAGITHPVHFVVEAAATAQRLDVDQLAWLYLRDDHFLWDRAKVLGEQKRMGVSVEEMNEAIKLARKMKDEMKKGKSYLEEGLIQLESGSPPLLPEGSTS